MSERAVPDCSAPGIGLWYQLVSWASIILSASVYVHLLGDFASDCFGTLILILGFVPIYLTSSVGHQAGHVLGARLLGWKINQVKVFRWSLVSQTHALETEGSERVPSGTQLSWVEAEPRAAVPHLFEIICFSLSGTVFTAMIGVCLVSLGGFSEVDGLGHALVIAIGVVFLIDSAANLIPTRLQTYIASDGQMVLDALSVHRSSQKSAKHQIIWSAWDSLKRDVRLSPAAEAKLDALHNGDSERNAVTNTVLYLSYLQSAQYSKVRDVLADWRRDGRAYCGEQHSDLAFCMAMLDADLGEAKTALSEVGPKTRKTSLAYLRAKATIDHLSGHQRDAMDAIDLCRKRLAALGGVFNQHDAGLFSSIEANAPLPGRIISE